MVNSNPPFDIRTRRYSHASLVDDFVGLTSVFNTLDAANGIGGAALFHGRMWNTDYTSAANQNVVYFLFNPSVIDVSHAIDTNIPDPTQMSADDLGKAMGPLQQTLSFTLIFDRTYETWDSSMVNDGGPGQYGCYIDIQALYNMVGVTSPLSAIQNSVGTTGIQTSLAYTFNPSGPMRMTPVRVLFSANVLSYFGYISELDIEYTHFTTNMVPSRVTVGVSMQLMIAPPSAAQLGTVTATTAANLQSTFNSQVGMAPSTTGPGGMRAK